MDYDFDLFIIGAGPAGLAAAKQATQYGVTVAIAEQDQLGGCCINRGCVPKKLMVYAADFAAAMQEAADYGWEPCSSQFHWQQFRAKRDQELRRLRQVQQQRLQEAGVQVLKGHTQFLDHHTLQVGDRHYTAQKILIAVGGKPIKPDIAGIEYTLTSDELLNLEQLPRQIAIIGGGYIGVEFASLLRGFGCDVTLMNRESCILEGFDDDVRSAVRAGLLQRGIQSLCNTTADQITQTPEGFCLDLVGDCSQKLLADTVLCAVGRAPNLEGLGLETVGIQFDQQAIAVDEQSRTTQPHIYAVGDCTNRKQLTPVARAEGRAAVDAMFSERLGEKFNERFDEKFGEKIGENFGEATIHRHDSLIPSAVLSRPEAAAIGLTETEASGQYGDAVACYRKEFVPLRNSLTQNQQKVLIKLVVNSKSDRILGIHIVGENAAEMIQAGAIALQKGMTRQELMQMIGIHPSTLEELFSV